MILKDEFYVTDLSTKSLWFLLSFVYAYCMELSLGEIKKKSLNLELLIDTMELYETQNIWGKIPTVKDD